MGGGGGSTQSQLTPQGRRGRGVGPRLTAGFYHAKAHLSFSVENELLQRGRRSSLKVPPDGGAGGACLPDGAGGRRQGAHGVSHVVWNVDGQRGDLGLHRLHRGLRGFALGLLPAGQRRERDLDVGAGEAEGAPAAGERTVVTRSTPATEEKILHTFRLLFALLL